MTQELSAQNQIKVLIVDDEPQFRRALKVGFEQENYKVLIAAQGEEALDLAALSSPQIVILDLSMPDLDGFEVCKQLREWSKVPVIMISSTDSEKDTIAALDLGADDFVVKPFGVGEIMARVRAILRRTNFDPVADSSIFYCDELQIDFAKRIVSLDGKEVHLTPKEYEILRYMVANANRVLTSRHLLSKFWGEELANDNHTLRVHIGNLRKKIEKDQENPRFILTEVRVGYRFKASSASDLARQGKPKNERERSIPKHDGSQVFGIR